MALFRRRNVASAPLVARRVPHACPVSFLSPDIDRLRVSAEMSRSLGGALNDEVRSLAVALRRDVLAAQDIAVSPPSDRCDTAHSAVHR